MAVRIGNAALDQYDSLKVRFELIYHITSGACAGGAAGTADDACQQLMGSRDLVLGSKQALRVTDSGTVEEFGILVFVDYNPSGTWEIVLDVSDPCGRSASISRQAEAADLAPWIGD